MASPDSAKPGPSEAISTNSHETALCIIPPRHLWPAIDRLRALYDKAYGKWPPHMNLIYPFVRPESLERASEIIESYIKDGTGATTNKDDSKEYTPLKIHLDSHAVFPHRHDCTILRHDGGGDGDRVEALQVLRRGILGALGQPDGGHRLHLTVARTDDDVDSSAHKFLVEKVASLPAVEWEVGELHILVRERSQAGGGGGMAGSVMKCWGILDLRTGLVTRKGHPAGFYEVSSPATSSDEEEDADGEEEDGAAGEREDEDLLQTHAPFYYDEEAERWRRLLGQESLSQPQPPRTMTMPPKHQLAVSSYNVLAEFDYPPSRERYPLIIQNMLSPQAAADVLVLQETTDDFLSHLLRDGGVRSAYPYVSHGPPSQDDVEPLPSFLNLVLLSRWPFEWEWVSFQRPHKGSLVARLPAVGKWEDGEFLPLVLAAVHLTHGLTDGAVAAKKGELQRLLSYVGEVYEGHPLVLAGDFNIVTSECAVDAALRNGDVTAQTARYLSGLEGTFDEAGLEDAWHASRQQQQEGDEEDHEDNDKDNDDDRSGHGQQGTAAGVGGGIEELGGELGATFDPTANRLAFKMVGSQVNNRPRRYDRILVRGEDMLQVTRFNRFGFITAPSEGRELAYASDHWGVRCTLKLLSGGSGRSQEGGEASYASAADPVTELADEISKLIVPVELKGAPPSLADVESLRHTLSALGAFPSQAETETRREALRILRAILMETATTTTTTTTTSTHPEGTNDSQTPRIRSPLVLVPVGSYGLGVWTPSSDMDVLCIGPYSSATFFALAVQRIRKAGAAARSRGVVATTVDAVRLLRRVRASTGTMLELEVRGLKVDLQYCAAAAVAETWPAVLNLPASDPVFTLPAQTLGKLKAARDMDYVRRSVPDLERFALAHRAVKTWARSRGIYSARFGYLGGIQISILLARVCKLLAAGAVSPDCHDSSGGSNNKNSNDNNGPDGGFSVPDILTTFFAHYAAFDWRSQLAFDPFFHRSKLTYTRTQREPLAILGYFPPVLNTSHGASVPSVRTIAEEFRRADGLLSGGDRAGNGPSAMTWDHFFCGAGGGRAGGTADHQGGALALLLADGAADFLGAHRSYVKIDLQYWGMSPSRGAQFVGWLESRCPALLVDMSRRVSGVHARMWPARFVDPGGYGAGAGAGSDAAVVEGGGGGGGEEEEQQHQRDYQGCYLVGLDAAAPTSEEGGAAPSKEERDQRAGAIQTVLRRFEEMIRGDERYFDAKCQWMSASVVRRAEVQGLVVDAREWGEYTPGEEEVDDDEDEDEDEDGGEGDLDGADDPRGEGEGARAPPKQRRTKRKVLKGGRKGGRDPAAGPASSTAGPKFRTAADVINRLRWDPSLDSGDYIVGYEDRFTGAMERPLGAWKTEQTDEEFIPQHRILYFKRRSDGMVVWERRTRKDDVFGSGVGVRSGGA